VKIVNGLLELVVVVVATLLIKWGALDPLTSEANARYRRRMSALGFFLLVSWIVLAAVPNFLKYIREDNGLSRLRKSGYFHNQHSDEAAMNGGERQSSGWSKRRKRF